MRKREFLRKLSQELSHLDRDEREDILDYYDELIEDRIEKTGSCESDVIYDLGEIEDIARRVDPTYKRKLRYEEEEDLPKRRSEKHHQRKRRDSSSRSVVGIVIMICLIPLWIALFSALLGLFLGIIGAGVGSFAGGILCIWNGVTLFTSSWASGLFRIGIGAILIGIVFIVAPLLIKLVSIIGKLILNFIHWLFGKRRRYA